MNTSDPAIISTDRVREAPDRNLALELVRVTEAAAMAPASVTRASSSARLRSGADWAGGAGTSCWPDAAGWPGAAICSIVTSRPGRPGPAGVSAV